MDTSMGLVLAIAAGLLVVAGAMGAALAFGLSLLAPLPAKPAAAVEEEAIEQVDERVLASRKAAYRQGIFVLVGLAVLTALEYAIAVWLDGSVGFLFVVALAKAGMILQYFMHLGRMWGGEEVHR